MGPASLVAKRFLGNRLLFHCSAAAVCLVPSAFHVRFVLPGCSLFPSSVLTTTCTSYELARDAMTLYMSQLPWLHYQDIHIVLGP